MAVGPSGDPPPEQRREIQARVDAAVIRDANAHARDEAARARDELAASRDRELPDRDARSGAAADREQAARDREIAARDRLEAKADRDLLLAQLALAETDPLTGARTRAAGLADLDNEVHRAQRSGGMLTIAYVDVVGLKAINDSQGHVAGDVRLTRVVATIREHLRSYDLIVRVGGDEFLWAMSGTPLAEARERFARIAKALASPTGAPGIRVGFAAVSRGDSAPELIARADQALVQARASG